MYMYVMFVISCTVLSINYFNKHVYHTYDTVTTFDLKNTNCLQIGTIKKKDKFIIIYWKKIWVIIFVKNLRHLTITVGEITLLWI